ncbi:hypothetical protein [Pedobacter frigiditerrae]|uniref:hypothetical protein n=1 Tax=Pedobacter frigiditerrae TaxID=2530452 RepID=UPI00292EDE58|nr:hypothetical protein [Pedobacter frigiditerrae]
MKNFIEDYLVTELTSLEVFTINGGSEKPQTGFWHDVSWLTGAIVHGFVVFATEGGRNAGISVR